MLSILCKRSYSRLVKPLAIKRNLDKKSRVIVNGKNVSTSELFNEGNTPKQVHKDNWNRAVSEAEKIVGYPTSLVTSKWLLKDEITNIAIHLKKLDGSNHPLLKTIKYSLYNGMSTTQVWGLIVLLVSKAVGYTNSIPVVEQDVSAGVLHSQRVLAEAIEMIRISQLIHQSLVNLQPLTTAEQDNTSLSVLSFGNKVGILTGDYLLGHSCSELAKLRNQELVELISSAVRDFTESEFIGERDEQNNPLPSRPRSKQQHIKKVQDKRLADGDLLKPFDIEDVMGNPEKEWELRHILSAGSLLGTSCQDALKLAGQPEEVQKQGYFFGQYLSLAWQACIDAEPFQHSTLPFEATFSLVSAPVLFHLEYDGNLYDEIEKGRISISNIDYDKIHKEIIQGPGLEKTKELQRKYTTAAMNVLNTFPVSDARTALQNIILAM